MLAAVLLTGRVLEGGWEDEKVMGWCAEKARGWREEKVTGEIVEVMEGGEEVEEIPPHSEISSMWSCGRILHMLCKGLGMLSL